MLAINRNIVLTISTKQSHILTTVLLTDLNIVFVPVHILTNISQMNLNTITATSH